MDLTALKEVLINGREIVINIATAISKLIPQFPANNIAAVLVFILSFWIVGSILNMVTSKSNLLTKLLGSGALFYVLWLW